jgi:hypothetical protein
MPEVSPEPVGERRGPEQSVPPLVFAAAGGPGSAELDHATDGRASGWAGAQSDQWDRRLRDPLLRGIVDATALLAGLLLAFCGMVLAARRLAGAMTTPPGAAAILAACAAAVVLVLVADRGSRRGAGLTAGGLARFGLLATVAALALPLRIAPPAAAVAAVAALAVAGVVVGLGATAAAGRILDGIRGGRSVAVRPAPAAPPAAETTAAAWDAGMQQRFERCTLADGAERVRGRVRVTVAAGSRLGVAHVGFCPPLPATPAVEALTEYDGVEAVVSAAEVLPWGVRIECRLDEPAEEVIEIPVDLVATART